MDGYTVIAGLLFRFLFLLSLRFLLFEGLERLIASIAACLFSSVLLSCSLHSSVSVTVYQPQIETTSLTRRESVNMCAPIFS